MGDAGGSSDDDEEDHPLGAPTRPLPPRHRFAVASAGPGPLRLACVSRQAFLEAARQVVRGAVQGATT